MTTFNIFLGDEVVGRRGGYRTQEEAQAAARRLAERRGSLPFEVRRVYTAPAPRAKRDPADFIAGVKRRPRARSL